ncbi:MAG: hypothetical protein HY307_01125, partial [Arcobacter sp.]|nr:hypothetical protein [Arcobacter sp.]
MEINDYLNNIASSDTSTLSNSVSIKALEKIEAVKSNSNTFTLDVNPYEKRSDLSTSLREYMDNLSTNQTNIQTLDQQSAILTNLNDIATTMSSLDTQVQIDDNQPSIVALLSKYNALSTNLNNNSQENQAERSQDYFDGILGAKPLDPAKIMDAVAKQVENVAIDKKFFADNIEKIENKALET